MARFRSRPVEIDAIQWTGSNFNEVLAFLDRAHRDLGNDGDERGVYVTIYTLEGKMRAYPGDWIIKGIEGEFYPCKDSVFTRKYEAVH